MTSQLQEINKIPMFSQGAVLIDHFCLLFVTFSLHLIAYYNIVFLPIALDSYVSRKQKHFSLQSRFAGKSVFPNL